MRQGCRVPEHPIAKERRKPHSLRQQGQVGGKAVGNVLNISYFF